MDYDTHVAHLKMSEGVFVEFDIQLLNEHTVYDIRMTENEVFRGVILRGPFLYKKEGETIMKFQHEFIEAVTLSKEIVDFDAFDMLFAYFKKRREDNMRPLSDYLVELNDDDCRRTRRQRVFEPGLFPSMGTGYTDKRPLLRPVEVRTTPKIGRNEPCQCGSGQKSKRCCNT
jgi:SEC-C motif